MTSLRAKWTPLAGSQAGKPLSTPLIRSSHCLAVAGSSVYIVGGELQPRTPVDADLIKISLTGKTFCCSTVLSNLPSELIQRAPRR